MASLIETLLQERGCLLGDGATGTNYFLRGLKSGEPPETWNTTRPEDVRGLHRDFIEAGSDIVLTNTFGGNRERMKLHGAGDHVREVNTAAANLARAEADAASCDVVVAGSMGPTGSLMAPLGDVSRDTVVDAFAEQAQALADGGADILWIETLSSEEEACAAVEAAAETGLPIAVTLSFDTGGRTMMGIKPVDWPQVARRLPGSLAVLGANCGVGPGEMIATVLGITDGDPEPVVAAKANCGVPVLEDGQIGYSGTPELMADYVRMSVDAGARIIGGCCGTTPKHVAAMRRALDEHEPGPRPDVQMIADRFGPISKLAHGIDAKADAEKRRRKRTEAK